MGNRLCAFFTGKISGEEVAFLIRTDPKFNQLKKDVAKRGIMFEVKNDGSVIKTEGGNTWRETTYIAPTTKKELKLLIDEIISECQ